MTDPRPNILFLILDTTRRDHLSTYGYRRSTTPALDAFAAEAVQFERAVSPSHWTIPVHTSLFTGLHAGEHGAVQANSKLSDSHPTLAEIVRTAGYETVAFCNNPLVGVLDNGLQRGFDTFYNYGGAAPNRPADTANSNTRRVLETRFRRFAARVTNQFAKSETLFRQALSSAWVPLWTRYINFKGNTTQSVDDLITWWAARRDERPLFAFVNLMGAHLPYTPPAPYLDRVAPGLRRDRASARFVAQFNADASRWATPPEAPLIDWQQHALESYYDAEIAHQDAQVGRLFDWLKTSGVGDNTLVIVAADHGEGHGEHDLFGHGFGVYQELVHVPLVLRHPDLTGKPRQVFTNISTRRVFHTVLDAAGVHRPPLDERSPNADVRGLSLLSANGVETDREGGLAFTEAFPPLSLLHVVEHRSPQLIERLQLRKVRRAAYFSSYKLLLADDQIEALYDVDEDGAERAALNANHPALARVAMELAGEVGAFIARTQQAHGQAGVGEVDDEVMENLRSLGYVE